MVLLFFIKKGFWESIMATEMRNKDKECLLITFRSCIYVDVDEKSIEIASTTDIWYIDSGASSHMTSITQYC